MKTFIIAALAASVLATPVLAAPDRGRDDRGQRTVVVQKPNKVVVRQAARRPAPQQFRGWRKGDRFESRQARNYRVISSPRAYRLREAPRGYRWVQSGSDAVLIGITSGIVSSVIANAIR